MATDPESPGRGSPIRRGTSEQLEVLREALAGRYRVQHELGHGGMATVYLADDQKLDRPVAIKVLRPELQSAVGPGRFLREIDITAKLVHPNILPLLESGQAAGLLYYVMPYVSGESLRERLRREQQLPIADAVQVAREVADALHHAHQHGVVHRDVKPANVLLEAGHAVVSDFGIAHAVTEAGGETLTSTGLAIGTPGYMSPEQAGGRTDLDGRSDVYGLGCVLYEMLAGEAPFTGPSAQAIIAKQLNMPVPPVVYVRETVPDALVAILERALAKSPADRFQTAADFARALQSVDPEQRPTGSLRRRKRRRLVGGALLGLLAIVGVTALGTGVFSMGREGETPVDTTLYAVFPFVYQAGAETPVSEVQRLHDALSRWSGVRVVAPFDMAEPVGDEPVTQEAALDAARRAGAGRYVRGSVVPVGDSLRVQATLYDAAGGGVVLATHAVRMARDLMSVDSLITNVADHLILRGRVPDGLDALAGTRSLPARQSFARGWEAVNAWDLTAADSAFAAAIQYDAAFGAAHLWLALARDWSGTEAARWRVPAEQATLQRSALNETERALSEAVLAEAVGDFASACPIWRDLTQRTPRDFAVWYGLAHCLGEDGAVLLDRTSPTGWSFRTSYHEVLRAYQRAFQLQPAVLASYQSGSYDVLRAVFLTAGNARRAGQALPPDTLAFIADPAWVGDSLALVPYQRRARITVSPTQALNATRQLRRMLHDVVVAWVVAAPRNANAMEALASSLAMLGDPSALDTLRRARALAGSDGERFRMAAAEVWMGVAFAMPWNEAGLRSARALADSLLAHRDDHADASLLTGLAALTGRAALAATFARRPGAMTALGAPPVLRETAPALLVYAAMGGPADSLTVLEGRVRDDIEQRVPPTQRDRLRLQLLARAATLAFPTHRMETVQTLRGRGDYLLDLQAAWTAGDTLAVRRGIEAVRESRGRLPPADLTLDALWPEAALLVDLGDLRGAAGWLDPTLGTLTQTAPHVLADPIRSASLVRAAALRAEIAAQMGDDDAAARWKTAVAILWTESDVTVKREGK